MKSLLPLTISLFAGAAALAGCRDTAAPFAPIPARIAFVSDRRLGQRDIWLMNTDGSVQLVTNHLADDDWPSWSPDGTHIAFESDRSLNYDIYTTTLDGSGVVQLTADSAFDGQPAWSPDGTKIAFVSQRDGSDQIYVMKANGASVVRQRCRPVHDESGRHRAQASHQRQRDRRHGALAAVNGAHPGPDLVQMTIVPHTLSGRRKSSGVSDRVRYTSMPMIPMVGMSRL